MPPTPLYDRLQAAGARFGDYGGAETAAAFSDPAAEFAALRSGCAVYDLGRRGKIMITGPDRVRWMNGMVTNNVTGLAPGRGVYSFVLNAQGRILGDMYIYNFGEHLLVDTDIAQVAKLMQLFQHYIIMDEVELSDAGAKLTAIGVRGPRSQEVLTQAGFEAAELDALQFKNFMWRDVNLFLARIDSEAYEIWMPPEHAAKVWDVLISAGATPVGTKALELFRIASGVPRYGQDIRERDLPQETGQFQALHFTKGCYLGQEIVERIHSRGNVHRQFTSFIVEDAAPGPGSKLRAGGKDVGELTSVATLSLNGSEKTVALGYVRREAAGSDSTLEVDGGKARVARKIL